MKRYIKPEMSETAGAELVRVICISRDEDADIVDAESKFRYDSEEDYQDDMEFLQYCRDNETSKPNSLW